MSENHRETYRALVRALRAEFGEALVSLQIDLEPYRYNAFSIGVLGQAVRDAADWRYDAGEAASLTSLEQSHSALGNRGADPAAIVGVTPPGPAATLRKGGGDPAPISGHCPDCGHDLDVVDDRAPRRGCSQCGGWFMPLGEPS